MKDKKFLQCMHCGYIMKARENETQEQLHNRFLRKHILVDHLEQMATLKRESKIVN